MTEHHSIKITFAEEMLIAPPAAVIGGYDVCSEGEIFLAKELLVQSEDDIEIKNLLNVGKVQLGAYGPNIMKGDFDETINTGKL